MQRSSVAAEKTKKIEMGNAPTPLVVQYLYVHGQQEGFYYPTARAEATTAAVASRYLECSLAQAASLSLREVPCELILATNVTDRAILGSGGSELLERIESLGVKVLATEYRHRPKPGTEIYVSSRYVLDAILSASESQPEDRRLWLTDLDCVWADPQRVFEAVPPASEVGCIYIDYPPDWDTVGFEAHGRTRRGIGELAREIGGTEEVPPWVGGELLVGTPGTLRKMVEVCEELDRDLAERGRTLPNEEQILSLAGAVGRVGFHDMSSVARRMPTGPRSLAVKIDDPLSIGLWHLPSEKGLSLRRTARQVCKGHAERVRRDLADPKRTARRFNVAGTGPLRRIQDDGWIVTQRVRKTVASVLSRDRATVPVEAERRFPVETERGSSAETERPSSAETEPTPR